MSVSNTGAGSSDQYGWDTDADWSDEAQEVWRDLNGTSLGGVFDDEQLRDLARVIAKAVGRASRA